MRKRHIDTSAHDPCQDPDLVELWSGVDEYAAASENEAVARAAGSEKDDEDSGAAEGQREDATEVKAEDAASDDTERVGVLVHADRRMAAEVVVVVLVRIADRSCRMEYAPRAYARCDMACEKDQEDSSMRRGRSWWVQR
jgi:hypothetical protein